jgi:predicted RNase H-like HicB family nuclease
MTFTVTLERDEDGAWIVECPAIPGCVSQGKSRDEALENIEDAIKLCLETRGMRGTRLMIDSCQVEISV